MEITQAEKEIINQEVDPVVAKANGSFIKQRLVAEEINKLVSSQRHNMYPGPKLLNNRFQNQ